MRNRIRLLLFCLVCVAEGCSLTPQQAAVHDFGTGLAKTKVQHNFRADMTVNAPKWLQDNRIRYRLLYSEPSRVRFYGMNRWIAPPGELLEQYFRFGGNYPNRSLVITLLDFEQQFVSPNQAKAVIRLFLEVYTSDHRKLLGTRELRLEQWSPTPDAEGTVIAFSELAQKASGQIQNWLKVLIADP